MEHAHFEVAIVGAGHAGAQAAIVLRQQGFTGSIALIGDEPDQPYERPPLSKEYLARDKGFERLLIRPASFWEAKDVQLLLSTRVVAVDADAHTLTKSNGEKIGYGKLIWATGGSPRRLTCDGHDLVGVHSVRTRGDVDRLESELATVTRVVVVGGGYIGLEAAAVLTKLGKHVSVLEALPRVLARVAGEPLSRFFEAEHRAHGVDIRLGCGVECLTGQHRVTGVRLGSGDVLPADLVIVGIGIVPAVEPLLHAGAAGGNGVAVDMYCRTTLPDVWAIGDCAEHPNRFAASGRVRLESVQNANDMATCAVKDVIGLPSAYDATPWFWSHQYDLKLQTVGLSTGSDACIVRGDPTTRSFSLLYLRAGRVIALDSINMMKDFVQGRALVEAGTRIDIPRAMDPANPLKELCVAV